MNALYKSVIEDKKNIVFLGGTGCGKSEAAINFAMEMAGENGVKVHLFDLDQTKPIYRSRDAKKAVEDRGITLHYEKHHFDAPTIVGGVAASLAKSNSRAILDIGGGVNGAKMIGRFNKQINNENTIVFYIINPFRPWCEKIEEIQQTLEGILAASKVNRVGYICNPALGEHTTVNEFYNGLSLTQGIIGAYGNLHGALVRKEIYKNIKSEGDIPVIPINLYLKYEWNDV